MAGSIKGITIEINGETTGLQKALQDVNKKSKDLNKELKDVNKLLKLDPKNTQLLAQKQKILSEQINVTSEKLKKLRDAQAQVNAQFQRGEINVEQYRAFQRELEKTEIELQQYRSELDKTAQKQSTLQTTLKSLQSGLNTIGTGFQKAGETLTKTLTPAVVGVATGAVASFKTVDDALDNIIAKTGATGAAAEGLAESFRKVATSGPYDMKLISDAIAELNTQFDLTGQQLESAAQRAVQFASITGADVSTTLANAKGVIQAYGLQVKDLPKVLDAVAYASQKTGISTEELFTAILKGAPQIKSLGLNIDEAALFLGKLRQEGMDATQVFSYLTRAQVNYAKQGKSLTQGLADTEKQLAKTRTEAQKITILSKTFGSKGAPLMLEAFTRGVLDIPKAASEASGAVENTFTAMLDPIDQATVVSNSLKLTLADIGDILLKNMLPVLQEITSVLQTLNTWIEKLTPAQQQFAVQMGAALAILGPLLGIIGFTIKGLASIVGVITKVIGGVSAAVKSISGIGALLSNPVGQIVAIIGLVAGAGYLIYKNWDKIKALLTEVWNTIANVATTVWNGIAAVFQTVSNIISGVFNAVAGALNSAWGSIKSVWNGIVGFFTNIWNSLKSFFSQWGPVILAVLAPFIGIPLLIYKNWDKISTWLSDTWNAIKTTASTVWNSIVSFIITPFTTIKDALARTWSGITGFLSDTWNNLKTLASNIFNGIKDAILAPFKNIHIPLPHFTFSTKNVKLAGLNIPIPDIDVKWYKKGGVFTRPSIIGVGEAGAEAVIPIEKLEKLIEKQIKQAPQTGPTIIVQNMNVREEQDIQKISQELYKLIKQSNRARGFVYGA